VDDPEDQVVGVGDTYISQRGAGVVRDITKDVEQHTTVDTEMMGNEEETEPISRKPIVKRTKNPCIN